MAATRGISHCYERPTYPDWPYALFTMAHGRSKEECDAILDSIAEATGIHGARHAVLVARSTRRSACSTSRTRSGSGSASTPASDRLRSPTRARRALRARREGPARRASTRPCARCARSAATRCSSSAPRARSSTDVDGNRYVDYVCSWGPLIHGHAHPAIARGGRGGRAAAGTTFGAPTEREVRLAEVVAGARAVRGHAADDLVGHGGGDEHHPPGPRGDRAREAAQVRRRLPRPRGRAAGRGGVRAWRPRRCPRPPASRPPRRPTPIIVPVERPGRGRGGPGRARVRRGPGRALPGQHGPGPAGSPASSSCCARARRTTAPCWSSTRSSPASASPPAAPRS